MGAGTELELEISTVAHGGIFVARHEGRVVFVADTLPGERVLARITDDSHDRFWRADTLRVLEPSPDRRPHVWAEADVSRAPGQRAGGAEFGHITAERQRALKREVIEDSLARMARLELDVPVQELPGEPGGTGWRTRVRLHVDEEGRIGPYAARSHTVVEVADLPLATGELREIAALEQRVPGAQRVDLIAPSASPARRLVLGDESPERESITEQVGDREFRLDLRGFWQVHRHAATTLTEAVGRAVDDSLFDPAAANLDLYGGVGLLAAAVGDRFGGTTRITSVESDARATEYARENLGDWAAAAAVTARVDRYLDALVRSASTAERARLSRATVVLDPPRAGAGKQVVAALGSLRPAQIVYVACDPVALARDLGALGRSGYRVASMEAFDLFPHTHHVEAVAALVRD